MAGSNRDNDRREPATRPAVESTSGPGGADPRRTADAVRRLYPLTRFQTGKRRKDMARDAAVFLDRDGVMIVDRGYVHRSADIEYVAGIFDFCREAQSLGFRLIVVTNQSGIARGFFSEADFAALSAEIFERFAAAGIGLDAVYFCPHHPTEGSGRYRRHCTCRKPGPGMVLAALDDFGLAASRSVFLGDRESDMDAARAAGLGLKLLLRDGPADRPAGDFVTCPSLAEAGAALAAFAES